MDAKKTKIPTDEAVAVARKHGRLVAVKGKKVVTLKIDHSLADDEIVRLIVGPSGNLRAPAWTHGRTLVVGYNADAYDDILS